MGFSFKIFSHYVKIQKILIIGLYKSLLIILFSIHNQWIIFIIFKIVLSCLYNWF